MKKKCSRTTIPFTPAMPASVGGQSGSPAGAPPWGMTIPAEATSMQGNYDRSPHVRVRTAANVRQAATGSTVLTRSVRTTINPSSSFFFFAGSAPQRGLLLGVPLVPVGLQLLRLLRLVAGQVLRLADVVLQVVQQPACSRRRCG